MVVEPLVRDAIIFASLLSLLSIGLTLTYLVTKVPNFSHGSFATIGIYVTLTAGEVWRSNPYHYIPLAFVLGGLVSLSLYYGALRPLIFRGAGLVILMIATIAYELSLLAALNIYADYITITYKIATRDFLLRKYDVVIVDQPGVFIISPLIAVVLAAFLYIFLTKTKFGVAMRAAIENAPLAGVLGINTDMVYTFSWFLAGGLASLSGVLLGLWFQADPGFGSRMLISIFAASIVGGLQNIYGGFLGGFLVGLVEILGTNWLRTILGSWVLAYRSVIPLGTMIVTLLIAPQGIAGISWSSVFYRLRRRS